jgi:hypothetical protein
MKLSGVRSSQMSMWRQQFPSSDARFNMPVSVEALIGRHFTSRNASLTSMSLRPR